MEMEYKVMKYNLLQIKDVENCSYVFSSFNFAQQKGLSLQDYEVVYEGETKGSSVEYTLEKLFDIFNTFRPRDFKGRSMSVSDIVKLEGVYYYCDHVGFKKITEFCS
jgi:hypothetical protein